MESKTGNGAKVQFNFRVGKGLAAEVARVDLLARARAKADGTPLGRGQGQFRSALVAAALEQALPKLEERIVAEGVDFLL